MQPTLVIPLENLAVVTGKIVPLGLTGYLLYKVNCSLIYYFKTGKHI